MANEIQMSARLYASKGGASIDGTTYTVTANMTGTDMGQQTQDVGNTGEALDLTADLSTPYRVLIRNLDTINSLGSSNGWASMRPRSATSLFFSSPAVPMCPSTRCTVAP